MFLFFTKNAYLLTAKITLDVYNWYYSTHMVLSKINDKFDEW